MREARLVAPILIWVASGAVSAVCVAAAAGFASAVGDSVFQPPLRSNCPLLGDHWNFGWNLGMGSVVDIRTPPGDTVTMSQLTLADIAEKMRDIDIAFLSTKTDGGKIATRPMSNNGNVDYDGDSYYFTLETTQTVHGIATDAHVSLAFSGKAGLLGGSPTFYAAVDGRAELIRDKTAFEKHWVSELQNWFKDGIDTSGLVLIKVDATRIKYWNNYEEGVLDV